MKRLNLAAAVLLTALAAGCSSLTGLVGDLINSKTEGAAAEQQAEEPAQNVADPAASGVDAAPAPAAVSTPAASAPAAVTQAPPAQPVEQPQQKRRLQDQLINAKAKVETAAEAFAEIKRQSQTQGFSPSPDITRAMRRAELSLEAAEGSIEKGEISEATESLKIAEASADQVLRAAGAL